MKEFNKCPICSQKKTGTYSHKFYRLLKCHECRIIWDPNPPKNLEALYNEGYFINNEPKGGYANYFQGMQINRKTFLDRIRKIENKVSKKNKMLDVGCALGDSLIVAKQRGWKDIEGIEVSQYAFNFAKKRGLKIHLGDLNNLKNKVNQYEIITLQDVIEHVTDPLTQLKLCYKLLKPGGYIFIVTPDIEDWLLKILGPNWYHFQKGAHVVYFGKKSIRKILQTAGFINIDIKPTYHFMSLEYIFNRLRYYQPFIFTILLKIFTKTPLKTFTLRIYTGELEALAQKP